MAKRTVAMTGNVEKTNGSIRAYYLRNAVLLCALLFFTIISLFSRNIVYKILASISFVTAGILNYFYECETSNAFARLLLWGLICGLIGDVGILIDFRLGALCFAIGHILYYFSFCKLNPVSVKGILPVAFCLILSIAVVLLALPSETSALMRAICLIYACIISLMTGKTVSIFFLRINSQTQHLTIGGIMFFLSDLMVLLAKFSPENKIMFTNFCRCFYFPAQFMLAQAMSVRMEKSYGTMK